MPKSSPIDQARRWWKERVDAERYVVLSSEASSAAVARVLRQEGLVMDVAGKRVWILTADRPPDRRATFLANYWPVVALVLQRYQPAALLGVDAIKLYLGDFSPPEEILVYHAANMSEYAMWLEPGFRLRLRPRASDILEQPLTVDAPGGVKIPILTAAQCLLTLEERDIVVAIEPISAWLRHLVLRTSELEAAMAGNPRPVVMQRLADMAALLHNDPLASQLRAAVRRVSARITSPSRTGVGTRIEVPQVLRESRRGTGSPWLDEQAMRLVRQRAEIDELIGDASARLPTHSWRTLRVNAEQVKAHDAYHSTTMEGYRISREISDAIIRGEPFPTGPQDAKTFEAAMAVQGYSRAFNEVLKKVQRKAAIDAALILDLYEALYRPAVDAGITDTAALRGWRQSSVSLRGWRYVPPNYRKVPDLIEGFERFTADATLSPITCALLAHLEFVTIHPFMDGNGRLGRLLMNYVLLSAGYLWVTIRADERIPFFKLIEEAQLGGSTKKFTQFLWHLIQQSSHDFEPKLRRRHKRV
jgi:Fic/DOC family